MDGPNAVQVHSPTLTPPASSSAPVKLPEDNLPPPPPYHNFNHNIILKPEFGVEEDTDAAVEPEPVSQVSPQTVSSYIYSFH